MKTALNAFFWLILRLSGIGCTFAEVAAKAYEAQKVPDYIKSINVPSEIHLEIAKAGFERQEKRNQYVLDKAKSLMTLVGLMMAVLSATSVAGWLVSGTWLPRMMLFVSLVVLLIVLIVLAWLLSVGVSSEPVIDEDLAKAETATIGSKQYFESILVATNRNSAANNFMVDVYRAANRLMLLGIALSAATVLASLYLPHARASMTRGASGTVCSSATTSTLLPRVSAAIASTEPSTNVRASMSALNSPSKGPNFDH